MASNAALVGGTNSGPRPSVGESNKFSCCAPPCVACWICSIFWPVVIGVVFTVAALTTVPTMAQTTVDGTRLFIVDATTYSVGPSKPDGTQRLNFTATLRMVNPMPIGADLPGGPATMSVNEAWSWFPPGQYATLSMPKIHTTPGSQTFTYNTDQYMNISNGWTQIFALGMTESMVFEDCPGCAITSTVMRPMPVTLNSKFKVKIGPLRVDVSLKKDSICHCIPGYPGSGFCQKLDFRTPYGNKYTPCPDQTKCPHRPPVIETPNHPVGMGIGLSGFHCVPWDEVMF